MCAGKFRARAISAPSRGHKLPQLTLAGEGSLGQENLARDAGVIWAEVSETAVVEHAAGMFHRGP